MENLKSLSLENEEWCLVDNVNGKYAVSNLGRVASLHKIYPIILKPNKARNGYLKCVFYGGIKDITVMPHRLTAIYFVPNIENKTEVNHINGIKADNRAENLEWVTRGENCRHAVAAGLHKGFEKGHKVVNRPKGSSVHTSVLTESQVKAIRVDIANGLKRREAAEKYNVKMSSINSALTCWKHLI